MIPVKSTLMEEKICGPIQNELNRQALSKGYIILYTTSQDYKEGGNLHRTVCEGLLFRTNRYLQDIIGPLEDTVRTRFVLGRGTI